MKEEYTLYDLNQFIRRFVALNVPETIWITAEISQANLNKGNYYIDLVQKSTTSEEIVAQSYAVLWSKTLARIASNKSSDLTQILKQGLKVRLSVQVDFHEKYGLKLVIGDIDEHFTYGNLALQRAKIIKRLQAEKLIEKNKILPLPQVIKQIAVLSSKTAAGLKDFVAHLNSNEYGYTYALKLFPMSMQGTNTERDFISQIGKVDWTKFDVITVIRGGGSKIDLASFDSFLISEAIAKCPIPVITGIGHEIDETIADMVAHLSLKTPTAVASFLINRNLEFESFATKLNQDIGAYANRAIQKEQLYLQRIGSEIKTTTNHRLQSAQQSLTDARQQLAYLTKNNLQHASSKLSQLAQTLSFLGIESTLKRGFTLTHDAKGEIVTDAKQLKKGDLIETKFHQGTHKSKIQ